MHSAKVDPHVKKLGLLDGWLCEKLPGLDILQYEDPEASDVPALAAEPERVAAQ